MQNTFHAEMFCIALVELLRCAAWFTHRCLFVIALNAMLRCVQLDDSFSNFISRKKSRALFEIKSQPHRIEHLNTEVRSKNFRRLCKRKCKFAFFSCSFISWTWPHFPKYFIVAMLSALEIDIDVEVFVHLIMATRNWCRCLVPMSLSRYVNYVQSGITATNIQPKKKAMGDVR